MPDHHTLKVGDRIRLLAVPQADLEQRERELRDQLPDAGWTADTIERILIQDPVVTINAVSDWRGSASGCSVCLRGGYRSLVAEVKHVKGIWSKRQQ